MNPDAIDQDLLVRAFAGRDIETCGKLYADVFGRPPWNESWKSEDATRKVNKIASNKYFAGLTAECGGEPVGYLLGYFLKCCLPVRRTFYLSELFIAARFQNKKIGQRLIRAAMDDLEKRGAGWAFLLTKRKTGAEALYRKMGFKRIVPLLSLNKRIMMIYRFAPQPVRMKGDR